MLETSANFSTSRPISTILLTSCHFVNDTLRSSEKPRFGRKDLMLRGTSVLWHSQHVRRSKENDKKVRRLQKENMESRDMNKQLTSEVTKLREVVEVN